MKSKQNESVPIHFLAHEPLKHTVKFLSLNTPSSTCTLLKNLLFATISLSEDFLVLEQKMKLV